jgi:hypothetical protein
MAHIGRRRGTRRRVRSAGVLLVILAGAASMLARSARVDRAAAHPDLTPVHGVVETAATAAHPVYPYSIIPGGAHSTDELKAAVAADPVVRDHYRNFDLAKTRVERLAAPRAAYVSYRRGPDVFWTRRRITIPAGEAVLTDGVHVARTRCGNQLADTPGPVSVLEPLPHELDMPLPALPAAGAPGQMARLAVSPDLVPAPAPSQDLLPPGPHHGSIGTLGPGGLATDTAGHGSQPDGTAGNEHPGPAGLPGPSHANESAPAGPGEKSGPPAAPGPNDPGGIGDPGDPGQRELGLAHLADPVGQEIIPGEGSLPDRVGGGPPHFELPPVIPPGNHNPPGDPDGSEGTVPEPGLTVLVLAGGAEVLRRRLRRPARD